MSSMHFVPAPEFTSASTTPIASGKIGGIVDISLNKHFYLQPGLFLSREGQTRSFSYYTSDSLNVAEQQTLSIYYIGIPINLLYKTGFQGKGRIFFGLGVIPSYILGGSNKLQVHGAYNGVSFSNDSTTKIVSGNPVAMFDIGLNLTAGYELTTGLFFNAYYTPGINDIGLGAETDKNRMWGIAAGYIFGKGRNINKDAADLIDKSTD